MASRQSENLHVNASTIVLQRERRRCNSFRKLEYYSNTCMWTQWVHCHLEKGAIAMPRPLFAAQKKYWPPLRSINKLLPPFFILEKSGCPPFFKMKKWPAPYFFLKKVLAPFFFLKKVSAPLSINPARSPNKFCTLPYEIKLFYFFSFHTFPLYSLYWLLLR